MDVSRRMQLSGSFALPGGVVVVRGSATFALEKGLVGNPPWIIEEPTLRTYEFREDGTLEIGVAGQPQLTWRVDWWVERGERILQTRPTGLVATLRERLNRLAATFKGRRSWPGHSRLTLEVIGPDRIRLQAEQGRPLDLTPFGN